MNTLGQTKLSTTTTTTDRSVFLLFQTLAGFLKGSSRPKCPECGSLTIYDSCPNLDCPIKVAERLVHWCSPEAVNIPTLGQATIEKLAKLRLVLHPGELYELSPGDWAQIDGLPAPQHSAIQTQMEASKSAKPSALLYGLRLPGVSGSLAKRLVEKFGHIGALQDAKPKAIQEIAGVDEALASGIRQWFCDSVNKRALKTLERNGFNFDA